MALRVVFANDHYLVREGVSALMADVDGIEVVAVVADPDSLIRSVADTSPDAVLTDIRLPRRTPPRASRPPNGSAPNTRASVS